MEELHCSPTVQRQVCPSPLRGTPSPSKEHLRTLYVSPVPRFMLDVVDEQDHVVDLPSHYLPDFRFRLVDGHPNPTEEQLDELASHFPGCIGISYGYSFLVVSWSELPVKPWPLTVGGVPLYYATPENRLPPTFGRVGGGVPIMEDCPLPLWEEPSRVLMDRIMEFLIGIGIRVRFFGWCGVRWYAEVESHEDGMMLPCKICGLLAVWKIFPIHEESGRRVIPHGGDVIDSTSYSTELRPGVLVVSVGGLGSTSGIPIVSPQGEHYVTVAAHSFPGDNIQVYHPNCSEANLIGKVDLILPNSDIALVKLAGGLTYSSTSFDGEEVNGTELLGLVHSKEVNLMATVYLDSPYNGKCQGIVTFKGRSVLFPSTTTLECNMVYFGNGAQDIFPGTCGSPIWTDDNLVAGFFRWYHSESAIAYVPSANVLIESGYAISPFST